MSTQTKPTFGTAVQAIYLTIIHAALAIQKLAMGTEEVVDLARNEVINLDEMQQIRLDNTKADRQAQRAALAAL